MKMTRSLVSLPEGYYYGYRDIPYIISFSDLVENFDEASKSEV